MGAAGYLPSRPRIGTTVRIDAVEGATPRYAMFFHCQTTLIADFRARYPERFEFEGNRALLFKPGQSLPRDALRHCIAMALTYHLRRKR